jgi:hypothetical protein
MSAEGVEDVLPLETKEEADAPEKGGESKESLLACFSCGTSRPKAQYSAKQLKAKGKRRCAECVAYSCATKEAERPFSRAQLNQMEESGALAAKMANAEQIRRAQESAKTGEVVNPESDKFDVMLRWLKAGNAQFSALQLKYYSVDYRGVHANRRLDPNTCVLEVTTPCPRRECACHSPNPLLPGRRERAEGSKGRRGRHACTLLCCCAVLLCCGQVPLACIMTTHKAQESKIGRAIVRCPSSPLPFSPPPARP